MDKKSGNDTKWQKVISWGSGSCVEWATNSTSRVWVGGWQALHLQPLACHQPAFMPMAHYSAVAGDTLVDGVGGRPATNTIPQERGNRVCTPSPLSHCWKPRPGMNDTRPQKRSPDPESQWEQQQQQKSGTDNPVWISGFSTWQYFLRFTLGHTI